MTFHIITIFPDILDSYLRVGMLKRARDNNIITVATHDVRAAATNKHRRVDDTPYGGGAGMVMLAKPIIKTLQKLQITNYKLQKNTKSKKLKTKTILLSAKGKPWNQQMAKRYAKLDTITFVCGRYEGVDERVKKFVDEEISIGDYVLTGGELGALVIIDSVTRLLPGVLGNDQSAIHESHSTSGVLEHPQYTRPEILEIDGKKMRVPKVLLSGNHTKIEEWRQKKSKIKK